MALKSLALVVLAIFAVPAAAEEDCRLELAASLPIDASRPHRVMVPAALGDRPLTLMIDTGSPFTALTKVAVARLGLEPHPITASVRVNFPMAGGRTTQYVRVTDFKLGGMTAAHAQFVIMPSEMNEGDGLIGADFLRQFDVEFDFAAGKLNLFAPHRCTGQVVYWNQEGTPVAAIPFHMADNDPHIQLAFGLDGESVPTILDTGAPTTSISMASAKRWFGIDENTPGVELRGDGRWRYQFKSLTLDGVNVQNPEVGLRSELKSTSLNHEGILGMDILRRLHLYIAYQARMLYVTAASVHR